MSLQAASVTEWFVTLCTCVLPLSSVGKHVCPQITSLTEWFVALCTFVRLLSSVSDQMRGQSAGTYERIDTKGANVFVGHVQLMGETGDTYILVGANSSKRRSRRSARTSTPPPSSLVGHRICRNLRVFGANFLVAIYASVLLKSRFAILPVFVTSFVSITKWTQSWPINHIYVIILFTLTKILHKNQLLW